MDKKPNVAIVLCRCLHKGDLFGIRLEEHGRKHWVANWAFPIKAQSAKREKFDLVKLTGSFEFAIDYPGCPGCGAIGAIICDCGKVSCWNTEASQVKCPWCGKTGYSGGAATLLSGGSDA